MVTIGLVLIFNAGNICFFYNNVIAQLAVLYT